MGLKRRQGWQAFLLVAVFVLALAMPITASGLSPESEFAALGEDGGKDDTKEDGGKDEGGSTTTAVKLQYLSAKFPGNDIGANGTVEGDLSERYDLEDDYGGTSVTLLDALVKMHIEVSYLYGDGKFDIANWLVLDSKGEFSLLFGRSDSTKLRCLVNDKVQTDLVGFALEDEDVVEFFGELETSVMANKVAEWLRNDVGMDTAGPDEAAAIFGLARVKYMTEPERETYYTNAVNEYLPILEENGGMLDKTGPGENARAALALFAIGAAYGDLEILGLLPLFADFDWVTAQGAQDAALVLLALDADKHGKGERFEVPLLAEDSKKTQTTREGLIGYLIGQQCKGGGWGWAPEEEINPVATEEINPVATAVVLQALAPYRDDPEMSKEIQTSVLDAVGAALAVLSGEQDSYSGSFGNTEANAQVIIALNTLGVLFDDPDAKDNMFVKNGETVMDALLGCYQDIDETLGAFFVPPPPGGVKGGGGEANFDKAASIWGLNALESYDRVLTKRSVLYDLSDVGGKLNMPMPKPKDDDKGDGGAGSDDEDDDGDNPGAGSDDKKDDGDNIGDNTGTDGKQNDGGGTGAPTEGSGSPNAGQTSVITPAPAPSAPAPSASLAALSAVNADAGGQATVSPGLFGSPGAREPATDAAAGEENGGLASEDGQFGEPDTPLGDGGNPVDAPGRGKTIALALGIAVLIAAAAVGMLFKAGILALPPKA
ncbi:hypothetical protein AGMMS49983_03390 [Clostridia bacterium]|nr:hypothetical protein AGMMS49983_03390 [Clostridia bacterium]